MNNKSNTLVLICVETNSKANTDRFYIDHMLKTYYKIDNEHKICYLPMGSKYKYNSSATQNEIKKHIRNAENYIVIYCLDTDDIFTDYDNIRLNENIEKYCKSNGYELVWFCKDVEDVFLHKHVSDSDKVKIAKQFSRNGDLRKINKDFLSSSSLSKTKSNIMLVFNKIFKEK